MDGQISFEFEQRQPIKGYPELHWTGKRPYTSTRYYPAQLKESYGEPKDGWMNKIFWGDNLQVMSHMLKEYRGKIDLIYIDPPFDSKVDYKKQIKIKSKKIAGDISSFEEKQYSDIWTNDEYLQFMYERLVIMRELLSSTGTIYVHCDYHKSMYIRCILDEIFGFDCMKNEITWHYEKWTAPSGDSFQKNHDTIFMYSKGNNKFNTIKEVTDNLKSSVIGYSNVKSKEFLKAVIVDFWAKYGGKEYEGLAPKMAIFGAEIAEVRDEIRPVVEEVLSELGIPLDKILVNVGDEKITKSEDIRDFNNLDIAGTAGSKKQFILLVNKGREGWNCRSLFSVALFRSPKSKVFVLQATMRCLRKITDEQLMATVYLSKENMDILDDELKKNFRTSIEELVVKKDKKRKKVPVRVKEPPRTLRMNRLHYKYSLETKHYDSRLSFGLKEIETENYDATMYVKEGLTTSSVVRESNINYMVSKLAYTEITLVAEVAKYFPDIRCTEVARILRKSEEGIDKILVAVNEHNDIIYDKIVPTIFEALYRVNKEIVKENVDVKLLKKPKEGGYYEFSGNEDLIIMQNSEDSVVVKNKDKSFHADTYVFDSKPELQLFLQLLANEHVKKAYFTGMFTADQTDFYVPYIDPESNRLRKYYPDFLVKMDDGSYLILEVKGDNMIDDPVVKAKGAAAEEVAVESSMKYEMLKGTDIMEGKAKF